MFGSMQVETQSVGHLTTSSVDQEQLRFTRAVGPSRSQAFLDDSGAVRDSGTGTPRGASVGCGLSPEEAPATTGATPPFWNAFTVEKTSGIAELPFSAN